MLRNDTQRGSREEANYHKPETTTTHIMHLQLKLINSDTITMEVICIEHEGKNAYIKIPNGIYFRWVVYNICYIKNMVLE